VYDRRYGDKVLTFEASGGLMNSSLVLQDRETDSYWPIMRGKSIHGELSGTVMKEVAVNRKMKWSEWLSLHPDTRVLSVDGVEDQAGAYDNYFQSEDGFRNSKASDVRLETKTPVFAFRLGNKPYAVSHDEIIGGRRFNLGGQIAYMFRSPDLGLHDSTRAYIVDADSGCVFDGAEAVGECASPLSGFDTFWYNWSLNNPHTELLN
jgi:Protein of unknown function (DUF3179)